MVRVCVWKPQVSVDLSVPKLRRRGLDELSNTAAAALPARLDGALKKPSTGQGGSARRLLLLFLLLRVVQLLHGRGGTKGLRVVPWRGDGHFNQLLLFLKIRA